MDRLIRFLLLFQFILVTAGCSGSGDGSSDSEQLALKNKLLTGESEFVFTSYWNCVSSVFADGFLMSFWEDVAVANEGTYNGAIVPLSSDTAAFMMEWQTTGPATIRAVRTDLLQATPDEEYDLNDITFSNQNEIFSASDSRGDQFTCSIRNSGDAAFCEFWGAFQSICIAPQL